MQQLQLDVERGREMSIEIDELERQKSDLKHKVRDFDDLQERYMNLMDRYDKMVSAEEERQHDMKNQIMTK